MTPTSAASYRGALWYELLQDWGYVPVDPLAGDGSDDDGDQLVQAAVGEQLLEGVLVVKARRPPDFGDPPVTIVVREDWRRGTDPERIAPSLQGCHLHGLSWHAQFHPDGGAEAAERLDLDRDKPGDQGPSPPEQWLGQVELLMFQAAVADNLQRDEHD